MKSKKALIILSIVTIALLLAACNDPSEQKPDYEAYLNYLNQGDSLVKAEKFTEAKESYIAASKHNLKDTAIEKKIALLDHADKLIKEKKFDEAKKTFKMVVDVQASPGLSTYALAKIGAVNVPLKITVSWKGDVLEIIITGGVPFSDNNQPYKVEGVECRDCIKWTKEKDNYVAKVSGSNINPKRVKLKDSVGQFASRDVPQRATVSGSNIVPKNINSTIPALAANDKAGAEALFNGYVKSGDSLFNLRNYAKAKDEYERAQLMKPMDASLRNKIEACNDKIARIIPMVGIGQGAFTMGSSVGNPEEKPERSVNIRPFSLSQSEVTVAQYRAYCDITKRPMPPEPPYRWSDNNPIVNVTWQEAKAYCEWVGGRLPTEAEWEYAAHSNSKSKYSGSDQPGAVAVYKNNSNNAPARVKSKASNQSGLYDMTGNVSEWCNDWFGYDYFSQGDNNNPAGPSSGDKRIVKGGAYNSVISTQDGDQLRINYRNRKVPTTREPYIGFRVAWNK